MAQDTKVHIVKVGDNTFKVRENDLEAFKEQHEGAEVVGKVETKAATKKAPAKKKDE